MRTLLIIFLAFPFHVFAETISFTCNYSSYSNAEGNHKVKSKFELTFIIDRKTGKSYLHGNNGSNEVHSIESAFGISFFEVTGSGNIMTTAIDSKLNSVHSRNTIMAGELVPSQYYGRCFTQ